ncbi:response regulator [Methyloglobulus sp.]|uniref:response regulator n=1 Tax=Methyloglobulus sp. TaxID=2518622 RepID=UPI00398940BE
MEHNNLQFEGIDKHEPRQLLVGLIGFNVADEESFSRFFQVARAGRTYVTANPSDNARSHILLVNYDDAEALREKDTLLATHPQIQVVAVSRGALLEPPPYHIRGMLFAARVLTTLDKVSLEPFAETVSDQSPLSEVFSTQSPLPTVAVSGQLPPSESASAQPQEIPRVLPPQVEEKPAPQVQANQTGNVIPITSPPTVRPVNMGGYSALVVDDSIAIQKSLELNLATLPQISLIDFADSGESAIQKADTKQYDLIFLDVMMPGIDGYETCTRFRKKPEYKKTPIIMVSGKTSPLDEVKGVIAGCTTYLTKPVQQEAFQKLSIRVLTWLEKQKNLKVS